MVSFSQIIVFLSLMLQVNAFTVSRPMSLSSRVASVKQQKVVAQMSDDAAAEAAKLRAKALELKKEVAELRSDVADDKHEIQSNSEGDACQVWKLGCKRG